MKKRNFFILAILLSALFFFNQVYAAGSMPDGHMGTHDKTHIMDQIKEKKQTIKHHKELNEKLEKQIEEKIDEVEQLLEKQFLGSKDKEQKVKHQIDKKLKTNISQMKQTEKLKMLANECINMANKHMGEHKPEACIKMMDKAIANLEKQHHMLVELNKSLDNLIGLLKSLKYK